MTDSNAPSINGSKSVLYPEQITFSDKTDTKTKKILTALVVLFFIATVVFMALFIVYYIKYDEKSEAAVHVCNSPDCVTTASALVNKMDLSVDPCQDFTEYACGTFNREAELAEGRTIASSFSVLYDQNQKLFRGIVEGEIKESDPEYLKNMKKLYQSCYDEAKIEEMGLTPYLNSEYAKEFPVLNSSWQDTNFNLNDLITKYQKVYIEPLFVYYVSGDRTNSSRKALFLSDASLGLSKEYFSKPRNDTIIMAYETYLKDIAVALGANSTIAAEDAKELVDFEIELSKIKVPQEDRRNQTKQQNPTTLRQLRTMYNVTDVPRALIAAFQTANVSLAEDEVVINNFPTYMEQLQPLLQSTKPRVIQNLFGFRYTQKGVIGLTKELREIGLKFDKVNSGQKEEQPRWETCVNTASSYFWKGMSKQFVERKFSEDSKQYMKVMIANLKAEFRQILEESTWMMEKTKEAAYEKLSKMTSKIGYPDTNFDEADLEKKYEDYIMKADNFYENKLLYGKLANIEGLKKYREPVDKTEWFSPPHSVNAYYSWQYNDIVFLAGILQPPFFSAEFNDAMNYGAIGVVIGHEITHGFDDQGSQFDSDGNLRNWWQPSDRQHYRDKTTCIVDQYSSYRVPEVDLNLNGIITQGENIADNGGLKESYRAYKKFVATKDEKVSHLPGLGLNHDQLFFLAYAQLWCEKPTTQRLLQTVTNGVHPPGRFRIKGPLQNSEDFAKAYNCPLGSPMNPQKKCPVW